MSIGARLHRAGGGVVAHGDADRAGIAGTTSGGGCLHRVKEADARRMSGPAACN
ncbi:MAG TPA: hypothetical protein VGL81_04845 [Polyangiaceae bacterium]